MYFQFCIWIMFENVAALKQLVLVWFKNKLIVLFFYLQTSLRRLKNYLALGVEGLIVLQACEKDVLYYLFMNTNPF